MWSVDFSDYYLVDAPLAEAVGRTGAVPDFSGATHVWLLLKKFQSASVSTVPRGPSASLFVGMFMTHFWRYL